MGCGELGTEADSVKERLSQALHLANTWNAVLLLDEADVFLEQRSTHDLVRNSIVSGKSMRSLDLIKI